MCAATTHIYETDDSVITTLMRREIDTYLNGPTSPSVLLVRQMKSLRYGPFEPPLFLRILAASVILVGLVLPIVPGLGGQRVRCEWAENQPLCVVSSIALFRFSVQTKKGMLTKVLADQSLGARGPKHLTLQFSDSTTTVINVLEDDNLREEQAELEQFLAGQEQTLSITPQKQSLWYLVMGIPVTFFFLLTLPVMSKVVTYEVEVNRASKSLRVRSVVLNRIRSSWREHSLVGISAISLTHSRPAWQYDALDEKPGTCIIIHWQDGSIKPLLFESVFLPNIETHQAFGHELSTYLGIPNDNVLPSSHRST